MSRWPGNATKLRTTFGGLSRSDLMARIRSTGNLTTEIRLAQLLRCYRLSGWRRRMLLPGKPDFVWPRERMVVFVDGCFWHGHDCDRNLRPKRNAGLWREKIRSNQRRDRKVSRLLRIEGWKVIRIWECQLAKSPACVLARLRTSYGDFPPLNELKKSAYRPTPPISGSRKTV